MSSTHPRKEYEEMKDGPEKDFLVSVATQISKTYKHKFNTPPEMKIKDEDEILQQIKVLQATPHLKFIHALHFKLMLGTKNNTYFVGNNVTGERGINWRELASEIHDFIQRNLTKLPQPEKQKSISLEVNPVKFAGDAVITALKEISKADSAYSKARISQVPDSPTGRM